MYIGSVLGYAELGSLASFPGLHAQLLSLAVRKAGGSPGRIFFILFIFRT